MNINDYLVEVTHAVNTVIAELHSENDHLRRDYTELARLTSATKDGYLRAEFLGLNPELDDEGLGTAIYWGTYFGSDKERYYKSKDIDAIKARLGARSFSVACLSGSLLQYAKQGIAAHYGKLRDGCPDGREIAGLTLHEIIWQSRNQALHWEEGSFNPSVRRCFERLGTVNTIFEQYEARSMAYEVVCLLEWRSTEDFIRDMRLLA
jgi:hypothetical protein